MGNKKMTEYDIKIENLIDQLVKLRSKKDAGNRLEPSERMSQRITFLFVFLLSVGLVAVTTFVIYNTMLPSITFIDNDPRRKQLRSIVLLAAIVNGALTTIALMAPIAKAWTDLRTVERDRDVKHMAWVLLKIVTTLIVCSAGFIATMLLMQKMRDVIDTTKVCNMPFVVICCIAGVILSFVTVLIVLRNVVSTTFVTLNPVVKFLTLVVPILMATPQWVNIFGSGGEACGAGAASEAGATSEADAANDPSMSRR